MSLNLSKKIDRPLLKVKIKVRGRRRRVDPKPAVQSKIIKEAKNMKRSTHKVGQTSNINQHKVSKILISLSCPNNTSLINRTCSKWISPSYKSC